MKGRLGQRVRTDFPVRAIEGSMVSKCRGIELSPTGILVDRGRALRDTDLCAVMELELLLPDIDEPLRAFARPIWGFGTQQAFKFVGLADADRLTLAELVDVLARHRSAVN